jgi:protein Mpv17
MFRVASSFQRFVSTQSSKVVGVTVTVPVTTLVVSSSCSRNATMNLYTGTSSTAYRTTSTSSAATKPNKSFMEWYESHLQTNPLPTKMVSGAMLWGLGDVVAQLIPALAFGGGSTAEEGTTSGSTTTTKNPFMAYDVARTARVVFYGFAIHAPCSHVHYNFLEWMSVRLGYTGVTMTVFKTFMEQFVYWSWISNALYHGSMGALQGQNVDQVYHRIADNLWETQKAQWVFWIPVQLLNFRFVPVRHQLNVVLITSIAWSALLSMWYPPEPIHATSDKALTSTATDDHESNNT